ncbi:SDR family NAD(P)-dependent oxidoreductase [Streptomyces sp. NPDC055607]
MTHGEMLFALSARTPAALRENAARLARRLTGDGAAVPLADVARTLALGRSHLTERLVVRAADHEGLAAVLDSFAQGAEPGPQAVRGTVPDTRPAAPVFVFSGHGSQWDGMGAALLAREPAFAALVDRLEPVVHEESGHSLRALLTEEGLTGSGMDRVQPAVYAVQAGLAAVWHDRGLVPGAVIGHSMGEVAAAVVAGALSAEDGARIVCRRSRLMEDRLAGTGATALVELDADATRDRLAGRTGISVAVHSSPRACVVAGLPAAVEGFVAECRAEGLLARLVPGVRIGAHSPLVDPLLGPLGELLPDPVAPAQLGVPFYTTTLDDPLRRPAFDRAYWIANLRRPVRLTEAVRAAAQDGHRVFLEVSPHPVVAQSVLETVTESGGRPGGSTVLGTLSRGSDSATALAETLAALHCAGVDLPAASVPPGRIADLPTYAWQRQAFPRRARTAVDSPAHPLLGHRITLPGSPVRHVWQGRAGLEALPWLADHRVHGTAVLPGTAYAELAVAAACEAFAAAPGEVTVTALELARMLPLSEPATLTTTLVEDSGPDGGGTLTVVAGTGASALKLARARVGRAPAGDRPEPGYALVPDEEHGNPHGTAGQEPSLDGESGPDAVYGVLRGLGQQHGPAFAALTGVRTGGGVAVSRLSRPASLAPDARFLFHPALLDACLHGLAVLLPSGAGGPSGTWVPTGIDRVTLYGRPGAGLVCRARLRSGAADGALLADVTVLDPGGAVLAELAGVRLSPVGAEELPVDTAVLLHRVRWQPAGPPAPQPVPGEPVLLVDATGGAGVAAVAGALSVAGVPWESAALEQPWDPARRWSGVVLAAGDPSAGPVGPSAAGAGAAAGTDPAAAAEQLAGSALQLVSAVLRSHDEEGTPPPPLTVLTVGSQQVREGEGPDPVQGALRGIVRSLRQERQGFRARLVDLEPGAGAPPAAELLAVDGPDEVAWRGGERLAAHLVAEPPPEGGRAVVTVRPEGGYVVTGGTRGLGLATVRWLAERGAGAVVLGGRGVLGPEAAAELGRIRELGCRVELVYGNVALPGTAERLVAAVAEAGFRLCGVVHTAAVLEDALVTDADRERLHRIWSPKAAGAWRLHEATAGLRLDWWVGFSSLASVVGSAGQSDYATANAFLDSVVAVRRAAGLPALAVNWGPWAGIGAVRGREIPGVGKLTAEEGFAALETLIARGAGRCAVARLVPGDFARAYPQVRSSSFFSLLVGPDAEADPGFDRGALEGLTAADHREAVRSRTLLSVGRVLGFTDTGPVADQPLVHLGLDSLAAVRIKNALYEDFGVEIPVARLLQGTSAAELAEQVASALGGADGPRAVASGRVREAGRRAAARTARAGAHRARRRNVPGRNA